MKLVDGVLYGVVWVGLALGRLACAEEAVTNAVDSVASTNVLSATTNLPDRVVKRMDLVLAEGIPSLWEIRVSGEYWFPEEDYFWDNKASGASAKLVYWVKDALGLALAAGVQKWEAPEKLMVYPAEDLGYGFAYVSGEIIEGDATLIPVGASILGRMDVFKKLRLNMEGGFRYVLIKPDMTLTSLEAIVDTYYGNELVDGVVLTHDIDMDNQFVALLALDLSYQVYGAFSLFVGGGVQFDITQSTPTVSEGDVTAKAPEDNSLRASFVRGGAALKF